MEGGLYVFAFRGEALSDVFALMLDLVFVFHSNHPQLISGESGLYFDIKIYIREKRTIID